MHITKLMKNQGGKMIIENHKKTANFAYCIQIFSILVLVISAWFGSTVQLAKAQSLTYYAEINKSFSPINILPGEISKLQVSIYNSNAFALSEASWVDDLAGVQSGITIASPLNYSTTNCGAGAVVTATAGGTTLALDHATVPALSGGTPGMCTVTIDVTSTTPGNLVNTIPAGKLTATGNGGNVTNSSSASATLNVTKILPPSVSKSFNPTTIWAGGTSILTINIANTDTANSLTLVGLTDTLPENVVVAALPSLTQSNCGSATITATAGAGSIEITNGTIVKSTTCTITLRVTSSQQGTYQNTIPAGALTTKQGVTNSIAQATLAVQALNFTKAFSPSSIAAGEISKVTITFQNPTGFDYTGAHLVDSLPTGMLLSTSTAPTTTCANGSISYDDISTPNTVTLSNATIPHATTIGTPNTCTLVFYVTTLPTFGSSSAASTNLTNAIASGALTTDQGVSNPASVSAVLSVTNALRGTKTMPASISAGGVATVTVTLQNYTKNVLSNATFTDNLPANLTVSGTPTTTCGSGTVTTGVYSSGAMNGRSWITLVGGTIPASSNSPTTPGTCTVTFYVTTNTTRSYTNTIPSGGVTATNTSGVTLNNLQSFSATTSVSGTVIPVTASKSFSSSPVTPNTNVRLRILITAPADTNLTNFSVTDTLPSGLLITNSTASSKSANCSGGTLTAVTGTSVITWTGGSITAGAQCQIDVYVAASATGTYVNTIDKASITNTEGRTISAASFSSTLVVSGLTMTKAFYPSTVNTNGLSQLTITLSNNVTQPIYNATVLDSFPTNLQVASPSNASTDCGSGTVTTTSTSVSLSGGTIPASDGVIPGICTITVNVKGIGANGTRVNTIPVANVVGNLGSPTGPSISPVAQAQGTLTINDLTLTINKGFQPTSVYGGSASVLRINIKNDNTAPLTNISFSDSMPAGMIIANPKDFNTGTCGGAITGNSGDSSYAYSGGYLPASGSCTLTLNVTMTANGNLTNTIPVGSVTSFNGATNSQAASASLTNLPGVGISKFFSPNPMVGEPGNYSILTITIHNTASTGLTGLGLVDNLPSGISIGATPEATTTCGAGSTLTTVPGSGIVRLQNGVLAGNSICTIIVPVTGTIPGNYTNTIPANSVISSEGATNADAAVDTLVITASPAISLEKSGVLDLDVVSPAGEANPGDKIIYSFTVKNTGDVTLRGISLTDGLITVEGGPIPSLAPGASDSTTFTGAYTLTQEDIEAGSVINNATVSGTSPAETVVSDSDTFIQTIPTNPLLEIEKTASISAITAASQIIPYTFTLNNLGNVPLSGITVTDTKCDSAPVYKTGDTDSDSKLDLSETWVYECKHTISQAEFESGSAFSNTVVADSIESPEVTDTLELPIDRIQVTKDADPTVVPETGGDVTFTFSVTNDGTVPATITSLQDSVFGTLVGDADCQLGTVLAPSASCSFSQVETISGIVGTPHTNTFTAKVADTEGNEVSNSSDANVNFSDVLPTLSVEKTASPTSVAETGADVTFTFTVHNTGTVSETITALTDSVFGTLSGDADCQVGTQLAGGASCSFDHTEFISGTVGVDHVNTFSAVAEDSEGNEASDDASATVSFIDVLPAISVDKSADQTSVDETGADVLFTFTVNNTGTVPVTVASLTDDVFGTLSGDADCKVGTVIPAGGSCSFAQTEFLSGSPSTAHHNTFTAAVTDADGNPANANDDVTVTFNDVLPSISVNKVADPTHLPESGGSVTYTYTISNNGPVAVTLTSLSDDKFSISGDADCKVGTSLNAGSSCSFTYTTTLSGATGSSHVNTVSVAAADEEGNPTSAADDATVTFDDVLPAVEVTKDANPTMIVFTGADVTFTFTVKNTSTVPVKITSLVDDVFGPLSGDEDCKVDTELAAGASCSFTQVENLSGEEGTSHVNIFTATVSDTDGNSASDSDDATVTFDGTTILGIAKELVSTTLVETGNYDLTFRLFIKNYGTKELSKLQVEDDLSATFPAPTIFTITSVTSDEFSVDPAYDGTTAHKDLLAGTDTLTAGESGSILIVLNVTPSGSGPFNNSALANAETPTGDKVTDVSQDGPDPDGPTDGQDGNPNNNSDPTPVKFDGQLYNLPIGVKSVDATNKPTLTWTVVWINNTNKVPVAAEMHDAIPSKTTFVEDATLTGLGLPASAPTGSTITGVSCDSGTSTTTETTACYYEAPTSAYPLGQIVWVGKLGSDFGITDPALAVNAIRITYSVMVHNTSYVKNTATLDADLNGDGNTNGAGETKVAKVSATWGKPSANQSPASAAAPLIMPKTGFAPGVVTPLAVQPASGLYADMDAMTLEIPALNINTSIVGVPQVDGEWDVSWLGNDAGWLNGTAFPTWAGNSVITGHVFDANGKPGLFADLTKLKYGDQIILHAFGQAYIYEVRETKLVTPNNTSSMIQHKDVPWLTLVTCRGYDEANNSYYFRYLVRAVQVKIK